MDWGLIGDGSAYDWQIGRGFGVDWGLIGDGLAYDWRIGDRWLD